MPLLSREVAPGLSGDQEYIGYSGVLVQYEVGSDFVVARAVVGRGIVLCPVDHALLQRSVELSPGDRGRGRSKVAHQGDRGRAFLGADAEAGECIRVRGGPVAGVEAPRSGVEVNERVETQGVGLAQQPFTHGVVEEGVAVGFVPEQIGHARDDECRCEALQYCGGDLREVQATELQQFERLTLVAQLFGGVDDDLQGALGARLEAIPTRAR